MEGVHFNVPVAVHDPPSTSATSRSVSIDHKIVLVCVQTLSTPIPAMISEITMEFTKLTAFSNFPRMFLHPKNHAQNIFEQDLDLVS